MSNVFAWIGYGVVGALIVFAVVVWAVWWKAKQLPEKHEREGGVSVKAR